MFLLTIGESTGGFLLLLISIIMIVLGTLLYFFPPKKINHLYGYRTVSSMSDQATWDFSQKYSGRIIMIMSFIFLLLIAIDEFGKWHFLNKQNAWIAPALFLPGLALMFILTERGIRKFKKKRDV